MKKVYIPQKEKHYTLEDWMIRGIISGKMLQWKERQELQIKHRSRPRSAMDALLDRLEWPSKTNFEVFLNTLSDENLNDLVFLVEMGETLDVNTDLDSGSERFLDFYQRHPELVKNERFYLYSEIMDRKYLPAALRLGQLLMELPRGTDISKFPKDLFDWEDGEATECLQRIVSEGEDDPEDVIPFPGIKGDEIDEE